MTCGFVSRLGWTCALNRGRRVGRWRGSRDIEHIGSAHDDVELETLKAVAQQRIHAGQQELDLGLDRTGAPARSGAALPITSSAMQHLWDALAAGYRGLGFDSASGAIRCSRRWCWPGSSSPPASSTRFASWPGSGSARRRTGRQRCRRPATTPFDPRTRYPTKNSPHTEYLWEAGFDPLNKADMESVVAPGDFLCLPTGAWHCAQAEEDSLALNLAFDHDNAGPGGQHAATDQIPPTQVDCVEP